ncbi:VWA domain-containing protein [Myxococcota bacterium]|nr:VWA domain-containing protein [Myxococcota bacterium]
MKNLTATLVFATLFTTSLAEAAPFQIVVPRRTPSAVTRVQLVFDVSPSVGTSLADPVFKLVLRGPGDQDPSLVVPAGGLDALTFATDESTASVWVEYPSGDVATVVRPTTGAPGDPARYRYEVLLLLTSDFDGASCTTNWPTTTTSETWTVTLEGVATVGRCLISYTGSVSGCDTWTPITAGLMASYDGSGLPGEGVGTCAEERPPVSVMMVLDRSCSMGSAAQPGGPYGGTRMNALATAVHAFTETWSALGARPDDKLGLVYFSNDAQWMTDVGVPTWTSSPDVTSNGAKILPYSTILPTLTAAQLGAVTPDAATSIGNGLEAAVGGFSAPGRRVIVLMTDGRQNTTKCVGIVGGQVKLHTCNVAPTSADPNLLAGAANVRIYAVTVGASTGGEAVNQGLADATGGFSATTIDGTELTPFFQLVLESFLRFNTFQAVLLARLDASTGAVQQKFHVTSTSRRAALHLSPLGGRAIAKLTSPSGAPVQVAMPGATVLPIEPGEWTLELTSVDDIERAKGRAIVDAVVIADDLLVKAETAITDRVYHLGDPLELSVRVTSAGRPIAGLGSAAGDRVVARVLAPGQSLGELLSTSSAPTQPVAPSDTSAPADNKLDNTIAANPGAFALSPNDVVLKDDGQAPDARAGDGIFSGRFPTTLPGSHRVLFELEGTSPDGGRFSRRALESAYVRPVPEGSLGVVVDGPRVTITPRVRGGSRLGPGWATYFVGQTSDGQRFRPTDQLDGRYVFELPAGVTAGQVSIGFLDVSYVITPEQPVAALPTDPAGGGVGLGCLDGQPPPCDRKPSCAGGVELWVVVVLALVILAIIVLRKKGP